MGCRPDMNCLAQSDIAVKFRRLGRTRRHPPSSFSGPLAFRVAQTSPFNNRHRPRALESVVTLRAAAPALAPGRSSCDHHSSELQGSGAGAGARSAPSWSFMSRFSALLRICTARLLVTCSDPRQRRSRAFHVHMTASRTKHSVGLRVPLTAASDAAHLGPVLEQPQALIGVHDVECALAPAPRVVKIVVCPGE